MKKRILVPVLLFLAIAQLSLAQDNNYDELMNMSLEELMQVEVYSVSKKKESLFEAPLSSSVVTREQITNAGITSIPEALRLMPGLIVRETTNGNYDVHIRGFDNLVRYSDANLSGNQITLVMVDGRPVFNNNTGGIFWESIPVDIIDVERIEVVKGPSAPLYGPNAVSGVINIITTNPNKEGLSVAAITNTSTANFEELATTTAGLKLAFKFNEKLDVAVSANLQNRNRLDDEYFSFLSDNYVQIDDLRGTSALDEGETLTDEEKSYAFGKSKQSIEKYGINAFVNYNIQENISVNFQTGYQDANTQRIYSENTYTPNSVVKLQSAYANAELKLKNLKGRLSYINGNDDLNSMPFILPEGDSVMSAYTYENIDTYLEYDWQINDKISLRPGIFYLRSTYSDEILNSKPTQIGVLAGESTIRTYATSLRGDYQITNDLKATLAGRMDYFTGIEDFYFSYQGALSYNLNSKNFLRAVVSKSNSGAFMAQTFLNAQVDYTVSPFPGIELDGTIRALGNQHLALFQMQLFEIGYRSKLLPNLELDVEIFHNTSFNSNQAVNQVVPQGYVEEISSVTQFENLEIQAKQFGSTLAFNYLPSNSLQVRPYITLQNTKTTGFPVALNTVEQNEEQNIKVTEEVENPQTPSAFGGLNVNYMPTSKWNINLNSYYMSAHTQFNFYDQDNIGTTAGDIKSNFIANLAIHYKITDYLKANLSGRNIFNNTAREYYASDRKSFVLMGGFVFDL